MPSASPVAGETRTTQSSTMASPSIAKEVHSAQRRAVASSAATASGVAET